MEDVYISHDTVEAEFDIGDTEVETSGDDVELSLDEERIVTVNNAPWQEAFDTERFLVADAVVARPIKQKYAYDGDVVTYKKPRDELKRAAWSLDNSPYTIGHPSTGSVRSVDDVHGFWRDPEYHENDDELRSRVYIPVDDDEAFEHISESTDVSVGFSHRISDADEDDVDGYQVDMLFDHVASVETGRCSGEDGCGIEVNEMSRAGESLDVSTDSYDITPSHGTSEDVDDGTIGIYFEGESPVSEGDSDDSAVTQVTGDYRDSDDRYYALSPEEGYGEPKYPIENCSDVEDAWKLRGHGDYRPSQDTLEERIKRRANDLDCDNMPWDEENTNDNETTSDNMTEEGCDCETDESGGVTFDVATMSVDAVADKHDGVQEVLDERKELQEQVDELQNEVDEYEETADELREELDEYRQDERDGLVDTITDITGTWDEDELRELDIDDLRDRLEVAKDVSEETATANADKGTTQDASPKRTGERVDPKGVFE